MKLEISIQFCIILNYTDRAAGLAAELVRYFGPQVAKVELLPSDGGKFEVTVNGKLLYSKLSTGRHANPGEVVQLVTKYLKEAKQ